MSSHKIECDTIDFLLLVLYPQSVISSDARSTDKRLGLRERSSPLLLLLQNRAKFVVCVDAPSPCLVHHLNLVIAEFLGYENILVTMSPLCVPRLHLLLVIEDSFDVLPYLGIKEFSLLPFHHVQFLEL